LQRQNRLANEKSPYLLEHAHNPVDWFAWGKEALSKAKNDNKPIFLSIGYSTCHWCHQMRKESFEDERVAAFINKNFIPIKVDREEMPEVDAYYMGAVQAMTGSGGWPLSVFLTPDLKPFYGGTYFPPEPRYGMPSFMQVLQFVSNLWKDKREEVAANSEQVIKALSPTASPSEELGKGLLDEGYTALLSSLDPEHGGFGTAPKFPVPVTLGYLLRYNFRTGKELALSSVLRTLDNMAAGGIRDHLGGGFHRYSTDRIWLVPHFEKMLYDNALLAKLYVEAYQVTRKLGYATIASETLRWMEEEMRDPSGGFYSAQDADTEEGEGIYYTWTPDEVVRSLGSLDAVRFNRVYGLTKTGNFDGRTILRLEPTYNPTKDEFEAMEGLRRKLYEARLKRPRPATDTKILTSWNGLAISGLAFAGQVLGEQHHIRVAEQAADFVLSKNAKGGKLLRRYAGGEAALEGTLEDYAFFVGGLIDLFEATSDPRWLREAVRLTKVMVDGYEDKAGGGFYLTLGSVPARLKEGYDGPTPSGNSVAASNLIRLAELTGDAEYKRKAEAVLKAFGGEIGLNPTAHTCMLADLDLLVNGVREVIITAPTDRAAAPMGAEVFGRFIPDKVTMIATPRTYDELSKLSTLLEGRTPGKAARAYVCQNYTCNLPAESVATLREQLAAR
jgi:uncharacterized protein YyaL (SSP411 family)